MWWTLNLTPNLTCVRTFGCRLLQSNQLTGLIPDNIGNLTNLQSLWAPFGVRNWRDSIRRTHTPWRRFMDGGTLKFRVECNADLMWRTLNLTPNLTRVCTFGCRALSNNQLLWASFGVRNWRISITRPRTPWRRYIDALKPDFCNKYSKHLGA